MTHQEVFIGGILIVCMLGLFLLVIVIRQDIERTLRGTQRDLSESDTPKAWFRRLPRRIHLVPATAGDWHDEPGVTERVEVLRGLGFEDVGPFRIRENPDVCFWALVKPEESVMALVHDDAELGVFHEFSTTYQDGGAFNLLDIEWSPYLDSLPNNVTVGVPPAPTTDLYRRFLGERPDRPSVAISAEAFVPHFERSHADIADWVNSRGGMSAAQIRRLNLKSGIELDDVQLSNIRNQVRQLALTDLDQSLRERFLSAWARDAEKCPDRDDQLILIHDGLDTNRLYEYFLSVFDEEFRAAEAAERSEVYDPWLDGEPHNPEPPWQTLPPRAAFPTLNARLPEEERYEKLGELDWPISVDVYRERRA